MCFGAGGTSIQVVTEIAHAVREQTEFVGYIADQSESKQTVDGFPVVELDKVPTDGSVGVIVPIFQGRAGVFDRLTEAGVPILGTRGSPELMSPHAQTGEGVIVPVTSRVGPHTIFGRGVVALSDLIAHDTVIGDFTTLGMHSVVLGHVQIGANVFIGTSAVIRNGTAERPVVIGDGAVIGVGAVVGGDVAPGEVAVSPRAIPLAEWRALRQIAQERIAADQLATDQTE